LELGMALVKDLAECLPQSALCYARRRLKRDPLEQPTRDPQLRPVRHIGGRDDGPKPLPSETFGRRLWATAQRTGQRRHRDGQAPLNFDHVCQSGDRLFPNRAAELGGGMPSDGT
jgi:hypothetical protein